MSENEIKNGEKKIDEKQIVATILEEGVDFAVTVNKRNLLHKWGILPSERKFVIYPIVLGTLLKISEELLEVDSQEFESLKEKEGGSEILDIGVRNIIKNKDKMIKIIAYGIINANKEPSKKLLKFLNANLTAKEALKIVLVVIRKMDVTDFLASIVSMKGMNLIEAKK